MFGAEPHGNYNRILLSPLLAGEKHVDEIMLHPLEWYRNKGSGCTAATPSSRSIGSVVASHREPVPS